MKKEQRYTNSDLQNLIAHLPGYICLKNQDGQYIACNDLQAQHLGFKSGIQLIGKTDVDLPGYQAKAQDIRNEDIKVMEQGSVTLTEESCRIGHKIITLLNQKAPFIRDDGTVLGIICTSVDITEKKEREEQTWILEDIIGKLPGHVWWKDKNLKFLGCNDQQARSVGLQSRYEIKGKRAYDVITKEQPDKERIKQAQKIDTIDRKVIETGKTYIVEEDLILLNGTKATYLSQKAPLKDSMGNIIGLIGTSMDITDRKESELLKLDSQAHQIEKEQQEQFRKIVGQAVHDIQSPLSSLQTLVKTTLELPEQKRIALRYVAMSIGDITNSLLSQYGPKENTTENNQPQPVLISTTLSEILSDRRHKFKDLPIEFKYKVNNLSYFAFIKIEPSNFRRMISNVINNAVEAMPKKGGKVELGFVARDGWAYMNIRDTGKGIPDGLLRKIKCNVAVTAGKKNGHGIGLTQIRETIEKSYGEFHIFSKVGKNHGTQISLDFPTALTPNWITTQIPLTKDDIVVILDDDHSIHEAWDSRFSHILEKIHTISVKHFTQGQEVINFIQGLSAEEKNKVHLLSDYELIKQELNGLQIIEQSKVKRATLVTSHYTDIELRKLAVKRSIKILPKELTQHIPFKITQAKIKGELSKVHMVFVDDEKAFIEGLIADYYSHLVIDIYTNPFEFLDQADQYPLNTKIILDNNFYYEDRAYLSDGISIAAKLHERGFMNLYLLSGEHATTPDYLSLILKFDENSLAKLDKL